MQALAKDLPWRVKEPRVVEILEAVSLINIHMLEKLIGGRLIDLGVVNLILFEACRSTTTLMGWWTSVNLLRRRCMCIKWSMILRHGTPAARLLLRNSTSTETASLHRRNSDWYSICLLVVYFKINMMIYYYQFIIQHTGIKGSIEMLLDEADTDKDGKISLTEFRTVLKTASTPCQRRSSVSNNRNSSHK